MFLEKVHPKYRCNLKPPRVGGWAKKNLTELPPKLPVTTGRLMKNDDSMTHSGHASGMNHVRFTTISLPYWNRLRQRSREVSLPGTFRQSQREDQKAKFHGEHDAHFGWDQTVTARSEQLISVGSDFQAKSLTVIGERLNCNLARVRKSVLMH